MSRGFGLATRLLQCASSTVCTNKLNFSNGNLCDADSFSVHTIQVPYLDNKNVILALLHHIHIPREVTSGGKLQLGEPSEKIFAFILGWSWKKLQKLWTTLAMYQEEKSSSGNVGITPKLFVAAVLKLYGFAAAKKSM